MLIFPVAGLGALLTMTLLFFPGLHGHLTQPPAIFSYGVTSRIVCTCLLCHVIYHSCDKGSWRQSLLSTAKCCNACRRNLNTGLTSAASLRVHISSTCKVGQKLGVSLSLSVDMLLSAVSVLVVAQSSSEIPEGLMNYPVYIYIYINNWTNLTQ